MTTPIKSCNATYTSSPYDSCEDCQSSVQNQIKNRDNYIKDLNDPIKKEAYKIEADKRISLEIIGHRNYHILAGTEENRNFLDTIDGLTVNKNNIMT